MSLIISLGTNLGNKLEHLTNAKSELSKVLTLKRTSRIYTSEAVDYLDQPDFYNQVLEFQIPNFEQKELMQKILEIELLLGRKRKIDKGPRTIDIDILFWGLEKNDDPYITIPHPEIFNRSFICLPLQELPYYQVLKEHFNFPTSFNNSATPI